MIRILIILILFLSKSTPSFSQKKPLPNGDDYYHSYTTANDTVRIYDIGDNLVREAYLKEGRAIDFNNEAIFWTHFKSKYLIIEMLPESEDIIEYLYTSAKSFDSLGSEIFNENNGKWKISRFGFKEDLYATSKEKNNANKYSTLNINKKETNVLKEEYYKKQNIHHSTYYIDGHKNFELFSRFNDRGSLSDALLVRVNNRGQINEQKHFRLKKALYDSVGALIELKEWRSTNYLQIENLIEKNGLDFFLNVIFEKPLDYFELEVLRVLSFHYENGNLIKFKNKYDHSNIYLEHRYFYDEKNRLVTDKGFQNKMHLYTTKYYYD
ncbi:hypothetical protein Celal_3997 [Cellulophaga algicola DSM 14237]|uniref:Uncharacterized protein n=1 Tax=Cellulophaga algicola (strain DSM 14237 / IC166 / ACAM 630) TaxID=688270 RepID=E6XD54_CELAD|nr:hypothetical protein [Cellulophaga algicola]ADV51241.1 hypothetical protein Celal_3997 [Cellulophaga algicola DSM 14237]